ncbi:MAG TPA: flippase-like domain-containing protein [Solirubrobacteraceae bacterium]|jgi:phosphatidylinositol alpha-mannosyltransferase|nr:flippase-like domain-containing protein [Solirubrobacteraceae bacterium]
MRIALVSPYSWSYPGGVTRHIEALAQQYLAAGHDVRVLAPHDPPDLTSTVMHRGAAPQHLSEPDYLVPLGRTVGFKANGAVSNLLIGPNGMVELARELSSGRYDVAHIHEPVAPMIGWVATLPFGVPLVGTFHSYSTKRFANTAANVFGGTQVLNRLRVRVAVSDAAKWTGERWYGGRYRVIPNGVNLDQQALDEALDQALAERREDEPLKIVFVGQAVERKGLPLLLRAFEALREHIPTELTVIGPSEAELAPLLIDPRGVRTLGKVDDEAKHRELLAADVLAAPSLGGESFGMVLTEGFASGTTVVASDIAGYRDVVTDGVDGMLVPPADPQALAEVLRDLYYEPERRRELAQAGAAKAQRFAWERVALEVLESYKDAIAMPEPERAMQTLGVRTGFVPADLQPRVRARRLESLERPLAVGDSRRTVFSQVRRVTMVAFTLGMVALAYLALKKIGIASIGQTLLNSEPSYVLLALATMCLSMVMRGLSWHAILQAALPKARIRLGDAIRGTMIGVLMSSTLPARLGEPSRALIIARRTGRPRDTLPVVLGTVVSQTLLNIVALIILGVIMFSSVDFFSGHQNVLLIAAVAPAALLAFVIIAPIVLRLGTDSKRFSRARAGLQNAQRALGRVRVGLIVFKKPRLGLAATASQLMAWALQSASCFFLLMALGLDRHNVGFAAAAAVLFAVNITAVLPATPANLGVFQAACATVLHSGWHIGWGTGVAYGVILQAVEVTTAILLGMPALLREGMSWREVRLRAMHSTPIKLPPRAAAKAERVGASDIS